MADVDSQVEYELREARSEISRHHKLIVELKEGLEWALDMIYWAGESGAANYDDDFYLVGDDDEKFQHYRQLLNRQVS